MPFIIIGKNSDIRSLHIRFSLAAEREENLKRANKKSSIYFLVTILEIFFFWNDVIISPASWEEILKKHKN